MCKLYAQEYKQAFADNVTQAVLHYIEAAEGTEPPYYSGNKRKELVVIVSHRWQGISKCFSGVWNKLKELNIPFTLNMQTRNIETERLVLSFDCGWEYEDVWQLFCSSQPIGVIWNGRPKDWESYNYALYRVSRRSHLYEKAITSIIVNEDKYE